MIHVSDEDAVAGEDRFGPRVGVSHLVSLEHLKGRRAVLHDDQFAVVFEAEKVIS